MEKERYVERNLLEKIVSRIDRDVDAAVVEGYSDKVIIEKLGFEGRIFLSAEKTVEGLVEDVSRSSEKVAVLTDFDTHGKQEAGKISRELDKEIDVLNSAREEFGKQLTSEGRMAVEDIRPLFEDKDQKFVDAALSRLFT
ncbi:MAG: toprim domain-containing protein [Candidatus Nanohalobium sp.]